MSEKKSAKVRIYKYAAEINLSSENLMEFLKSKGYEIKSHQSILTEDMMAEVNAHFKKDIEKAEAHYKRIAEFNKKRAEKSEKDEVVETVEETEAKPEEAQEIVITDVKGEEQVEKPQVIEEVAKEEERLS